MSFTRNTVRLVAVLVISAFAAIPAQAFWYAVHGTAGFVEVQTEAYVTAVKKYQWGVEVTFKKGSFVWIAFPMTNPTQNDIIADKIQFQWKTSSAKVSIERVYISDGSNSFFDRQVNVPGSTSQPKTTTVSIPVTYQHYLTDGVGIILQARNRSNKDETITVGSVGVNLIEK